MVRVKLLTDLDIKNIYVHINLTTDQRISLAHSSLHFKCCTALAFYWTHWNGITARIHHYHSSTRTLLIWTLFLSFITHSEPRSLRLQNVMVLDSSLEIAHLFFVFYLLLFLFWGGGWILFPTLFYFKWLVLSNFVIRVIVSDYRDILYLKDQEKTKQKKTLKKNHFPFDQQPIETCWLLSDIIALLINLLLALLLYRTKPLQEC